MVFGLVNMAVKVSHDASNRASKFVLHSTVSQESTLLLSEGNILGYRAMNDKEEALVVGIHVVQLSP